MNRTNDILIVYEVEYERTTNSNRHHCMLQKRCRGKGYEKGLQGACKEAVHRIESSMQLNSMAVHWHEYVRVHIDI